MLVQACVWHNDPSGPVPGSVAQDMDAMMLMASTGLPLALIRHHAIVVVIQIRQARTRDGPNDHVVVNGLKGCSTAKSALFISP